MPFDNLAKKHFSEKQITELDTALQLVIDCITDMSENLSPKERSKYGKVGPLKELLIDKVWDYHESEADKSAPDVNWEEFRLDYNDRKTASQMLSKVRSIEYMLMNIKILADYDNYNAALLDYQYAQYRNRSELGGFSTKIDEIKVFFPKTGKKHKNKNPE